MTSSTIILSCQATYIYISKWFDRAHCGPHCPFSTSQITANYHIMRGKNYSKWFPFTFPFHQSPCSRNRTHCYGWTVWIWISTHNKNKIFLVNVPAPLIDCRRRLSRRKKQFSLPFSGVASVDFEAIISLLLKWNSEVDFLRHRAAVRVQCSRISTATQITQTDSSPLITSSPE